MAQKVGRHTSGFVFTSRSQASGFTAAWVTTVHSASRGQDTEQNSAHTHNRSRRRAHFMLESRAKGPESQRRPVPAGQGRPSWCCFPGVTARGPAFPARLLGLWVLLECRFSFLVTQASSQARGLGSESALPDAKSNPVLSVTPVKNRQNGYSVSCKQKHLLSTGFSAIRLLGSSPQLNPAPTRPK